MAALMNSETSNKGKNENVAIINARDAQKVRKIFQENKIFDNSRRLKKISEGRIAIPLKDSIDLDPVIEHLCKIGITIETDILKLPLSKTALSRTPYDVMVGTICGLMGDISTLVKDIPTHWERHGDLVVFPVNTFTHPTWQSWGPRLWQAVATSLRCSRLAQKGTISSNGYRSPQVVLLLGESGWVEHVDNGIRYTYDLTKCMFSAGNITEKMRVAGFNCAGETVVDLYAGIGYFTLPYLVHAKAAHVHACEWNPDAVEALQKSLVLNRVCDKCTVYQGDNRETCPKNIADRVNLGLIPSSEEGWPVACRALKSSGGFLHIHSNVTSKHSNNPDCSGNQGDSIVKSDSSKCFKGKNKEYFGNFGDTDSKAVSLTSLEFSNNHVKSDSSECLNSSGNLGGISDIEEAMYHRNVCDNETMLSNDVGNILSNENACTNQDNTKEIILHSENFCEDLASLKRTCSRNIKNNQFSANEISRRDWRFWAEDVAQKISRLCTEVRDDKYLWTVDIQHIEHVKSYAPHINHLVLDLECRPTKCE
ncbi:tRNA wybutosine-synthesizing protein 2 homolog [Argopecten irradians]|uniref:tRNA wybutosine-synthesizing protein 2 homolog n=1 Tax=Argopecten irradians TaxID=31199 RepID=UPI003719C85C